MELTQGSNTSPAYHGQATLSRWKISSSRIIQDRLGGRIALVSEINISGVSVATYNLHLESRGNDALRLAQLDEVLKDARACQSPRLAVIAGDLNLNASNSSVADEIARAGFTYAVPTERVATTPARHLFEPGRHIDWAFVRGPVQINKGRVHNSIKASDHYPVSFEVSLSRGY